MSMSTKSASRTSTTAPVAAPVEIRATDASRLYTHVHPVLLLAGYFFQFNSIVADPVVALTSGLLPLSVLQISYLITCLPVAGTSTGAISPKQSQRKKPVAGKNELNLGDRIVVSQERVSTDPYSKLTSLLAGVHLLRPIFCIWRSCYCHPPRAPRGAFHDASSANTRLRSTYVPYDHTPLSICPWCRS